LELTAMRHMKHLSHFAEELADSGHDLDFRHPTIDTSRSVKNALASDLELTHEARERFVELSQHPELNEHRGLKTEVEHMISQETFLAAGVEGLIQESASPEGAETEPEPEATEQEPQDDTTGFTVGSLIK